MPEQIYHTRPMPAGWSKQREIRKLSESRAEFEWDIPLAQLPGIPEELSAAVGTVHAQLRFGAEQGFCVARLGLQAQVELACQRCLQPMSLSLDTHSRVAVVAKESEADAVPADWETFLAPEGHLTGAALVAEELLLALPIVPLHAADQVCGMATAAADTAPAAICGQPGAAPSAGPDTAVATTRPFADLRALLGRGTH